MSDDSFLGLGQWVQLAAIGLLGLVLVVAGLLMGSAVDASYSPLVFGIGVVMVLYAAVSGAWRAVAEVL